MCIATIVQILSSQFYKLQHYHLLAHAFTREVTMTSTTFHAGELFTDFKKAAQTVYRLANTHVRPLTPSIDFWMIGGLIH